MYSVAMDTKTLYPTISIGSIVGQRSRSDFGLEKLVSRKVATAGHRAGSLGGTGLLELEVA